MGDYSSYRLDCGHVHVLCLQRKTDECGMACSGMIIAMTKAVFTPLSQLRSESQNLGGMCYRPSPEDAGAQVKDPRQALMAAAFAEGLKGGYAGTGINNVNKLITSHNVATKCENENQIDFATAAGRIQQYASQGKPLVAGVAWNGGGGHFIVVHGVSKGKYCILDPGHNGVVQTTASGSALYNAPYGSNGKFDSYIVAL
jgi:hypothetical protein